MEEGYINLVNAIILQAIKDYVNAQNRIRKHPFDYGAGRIMHEVESFLRSGWFEMLTDLDGEWLLERIKKWDTF